MELVFIMCSATQATGSYTLDVCIFVEMKTFLELSERDLLDEQQSQAAHATLVTWG